MRTLLTAFAVLVACGLAYLFLWPLTPDPVAWEPRTAPMPGEGWPENAELRLVTRVGQEEFQQAADIAMDDEGRLYAGTGHGTVRRTVNEEGYETFAITRGRPVGMQFDGDGNLIVADAWEGLLSIDPDGEITVLATEANGIPFGLLTGLDIAADGGIYFADASIRHDPEHYLLALLEGAPDGRLLRYDPETEETEVLFAGLHFPYGVALSEEEDYLLFSESARYRIMRLALGGEGAGPEVHMDNLPGYPANITRLDAERFWVGIPALRSPLVDRVQRSVALKRAVLRLGPVVALMQPPPEGMAMQINARGDVLQTLQDPGGRHLYGISSVRRLNGALYFGSLYGNAVGRLALDEDDEEE